MAGEKKPRIRKAETVRQRTEQASRKAEAESTKVRRRPLQKGSRSVLGGIKKVFKPLYIRPVRFVFRWLGRILLPRYVRNSFGEIRQVTWPSRRETWKLTFAVLLFATVFGLFIGLVDFGLDKVIRRIVLRA